MPPIPAAISAYGPAALTLLLAFAAAAACRAKARQAWLRPGLAASCLLGWAALEPLGRLRAAALVSAPGPASLLLPATAVLLVEIARTLRRGRNDRVLSILAAAVVGWWLARTAAAPGEFWRVAIVAGALTGAVAALVRGRPERALALALSFWGAAAVAGFPLGWTLAAASLGAASLAPVALRLPSTVPSALVAALLAAADLARGRLPHGRLSTADLACLLPLLAPPLLELVQPRFGKRWTPLAPWAVAAAVTACVWLLHRGAVV